MNPTVNIAFPLDPAAPISTRGIQFTAPPLPDEDRLRQCQRQFKDRSKDEFLSCVVDQAMPKQYQITRQCIKDNQGDGGRALACSTGNKQLIAGYDKFKKVSSCTRADGNDQYQIAQCIGDATLGDNERYYLACVTRNKGLLWAAAVCALAKDLTPEQQIAIACAIQTGGQPYAFAACTGGQLLSRELDKCWQNGIGTDDGCFGPNNEYKKFLSGVDEQMRRTFGDQSVAYQAYQLWQNNVLAPGPNHEVVKFMNNGLHDIQNGPGPNNEYVKAGNAVVDAIQSVGKSLGF